MVEKRAAASKGHVFMAPKASVHVGNIAKDAGMAFSKDMFKNLKALCPDPLVGTGHVGLMSLPKLIKSGPSLEILTCREVYNYI